MEHVTAVAAVNVAQQQCGKEVYTHTHTSFNVLKVSKKSSMIADKSHYELTNRNKSTNLINKLKKFDSWKGRR